MGTNTSKERKRLRREERARIEQEKKEKLAQPDETSLSVATNVQTWWRNRWALLLMLVLAEVTFAVYTPSLKNGFTNWDDISYVSQSTLIQGLSIDHLKEIAKTPVRANYHPLTILSLALDYKFAQLDPWQYHFTNLVLHILNSLLVFIFIYELSKGNLITAGITSLLFGIHPMHVESVAWISERKDVLYTFFYLIALILYLQTVRAGQIVLLLSLSVPE